ncbi:MAG: isochorismate synthase [Myxococcales bacterium]|nr:isochorismate synthase [Myxococcales bacterium]
MILQTNPSIASAASEPSREDFLDYCEGAFAQARSAGKSLVRLTVAAPLAPLLSQPKGSMLWAPPTGNQVVGAGQAATIVGHGDKRYEQIGEGADALWASLCDAPRPNSGGERPRLFGGLSFAPREAKGAWSNFGEGLFWLPRMLYGKSGESAWLSLTISIDGSPRNAAEEMAEEIRRLLLDDEATVRQAQIDHAEHLAADAWAARIEAIREAIGTGKVNKVVAARSSLLHFHDSIALSPALERLSERYPDCYRYAFQQERATFVGASPETLVNKQGLNVSTQALAGSLAADLENAGQALLGSSKDRHEQEMVVRAIADALEPLCKSLEFEDTPTTRTLRHVTHLCTPIEGQLAEAKHVLDLVQALHPTPAVGGSPAGVAMQWIEDAEENRGWYAGPVGWFDAEGDGHFAVAIRSALFTGSEALVYAGAGIVADSDPALEYQETGLKQRAILDALGIIG